VGGAVYLNAAARLRGETGPVSSLRALEGAQIETFVNPDLGKVVFKQAPAAVTAGEGHRARFSVKVESDQAPLLPVARERR
jgi:hypothetical protein